MTGHFYYDSNQIGDILKSLKNGKAQFFTNTVITAPRALDIILSNGENLAGRYPSPILAVKLNKLTIDTSYKLDGKETFTFIQEKNTFQERMLRSQKSI